MTRKAFELPLSPQPQQFAARLGGTQYLLTFRFNSEAECWMLSIATSGKVPILDNLPVVTGIDMLAMYRYAGIEGSLVVQTDHDTDAVPTFENLGRDGKVYYVITT